MAVINFGATVTLNQAAQLIMTNPLVRFLVRGEPGIGKSTMLSYIAKLKASTHNASYMDVPNMDLGDIAMPVIDHDAKVTRYYPNARFRLHEKKPVIIMLDEFTKGADPIKNMLHPLLEVTAPRLGDLFIDEGVEDDEDRSIIFMTGNLLTDGVGATASWRLSCANRTVTSGWSGLSITTSSLSLWHGCASFRMRWHLTPTGTTTTPTSTTPRRCRAPTSRLAHWLSHLTLLGHVTRTTPAL